MPSIWVRYATVRGRVCFVRLVGTLYSPCRQAEELNDVVVVVVDVAVRSHTAALQRALSSIGLDWARQALGPRPGADTCICTCICTALQVELNAPASSRVVIPGSHDHIRPSPASGLRGE